MPDLQIHALGTVRPTYQATKLPGVIELLRSIGLPEPCFTSKALVPWNEKAGNPPLALYFMARIRAHVQVGDASSHHHSVLIATDAALRTWLALNYPRRGNWLIDPWFELACGPGDVGRRTLSAQYQLMAARRSHRSAPRGMRFVSAHPPWSHGRLAATRVLIPV